MRLSDFDYHLPPERIAQTPLTERDQSRLMVLDRAIGEITHHRFFELPELLPPNAVLVFNESRVIPARLRFQWGNGMAEILLVKPLSDGRWECLVRPGPKFQPGAGHTLDPDCAWIVRNVTPEGLRIIEFKCEDFGAYLKSHGQTPTPPYIKQPVTDSEQYQTIYARREGSVAAPTAGFHFTQRTFDALKAKGIGTEFVTLHVGLGTFAPVKTEDITKHPIHSEWFELSPEVAMRLNAAKASGRPIVAVGTTSVRVLESCASESGVLTARSGETRCFIYPGYRFKFIDQLVTNFHVPKSSLLMLVSAFAECHSEACSDEESPGLLVTRRLFARAQSDMSGRDFILRAYELAKNEGYRFFSFGDAMFIQ